MKFKVIALSFLLASCVSWLPSLSGGTNVAANTQLGKENNQTGVQIGEVKESKVEAQDIGKLSQAENAIEAAQVSIQNIPPWAIILIILGWILPTPMEIWTGTKNTIKDFFVAIGDGIRFVIGLFKRS